MNTTEQTKPMTRSVVGDLEDSGNLTSVEICAGGGGQALGLEQAGFSHRALVEIDKHACATLRANRPNWNVIHADLHDFVGQSKTYLAPFHAIDLLAGGVPCPPFSIAGKQLGADDDRNLFALAIKLVSIIRPRAVMLENVRGLSSPLFSDFRESITRRLAKLGYAPYWQLLNACDFGVPQLRPRLILVAIRKTGGNPALSDGFVWPKGRQGPPAKTVGETLFDLMASNGWKRAREWRRRADSIAPTLVGGSLKHGGADLGPTRARKAWASLGVDGLGIADQAPAANFVGSPKLTVRMAARLQGFPDDWQLMGGKTAAYRQVGNAFPPPVAQTVASRIAQVLLRGSTVIDLRSD